MNKNLSLAFLSVGLVLAVGCSDDDGAKGPSEGEIEIAGSWDGEFGDTEVIDSDSWAFAFETAALVAFDNRENYAITENPADAEYDPGKYNKIVWTEPEDGTFYYCTVAFGVDSPSEAEASEQEADESDIEKGCGGFAWSKLSEKSDG